MSSLAGAAILPQLKKTFLVKNTDMAAQDHRDEIFYDIDRFDIQDLNYVTGELDRFVTSQAD